MRNALTAPPREPARPSSGDGPFRAYQIREGDPYELSDGHAIACMSSGERHGTANLYGATLIASDPDVDGAGVDVGVEFNDGKNLRAPDVSVGNVSDRPGWARALPPLAVEFADKGQDERELAAKVRELLAHGTRFVWVVRLVGPRRVEVYAPKQRCRVLSSGQELRAPGVLRNPIPVDAFYERDQAEALTLRNLLQRRGVESLDALREGSRAEGLRQGHEEGLRQGHEEGLRQANDGLRQAIAGMVELLGLKLSRPRSAALARMDTGQLESLIQHLRQHRTWPR